MKKSTFPLPATTGYRNTQTQAHLAHH